MSNHPISASCQVGTNAIMLKIKSEGVENISEDKIRPKAPEKLDDLSRPLAPHQDTHRRV